MNSSTSIEAIVKQYLGAVKQNISHTSADQQDTLLRELREHIYEGINTRTSGRAATVQDAYAMLAEMDAPETYAATSSAVSSAPKVNIKLIAISIGLCLVQVAGLGATLAGIPIAGSIGGFAAIVNFFLIWSYKQSSKKLVCFLAFAAICSLVGIVLDIARSL